MSLAALKQTLGENSFVTPEKVQARPGCATGWAPLDHFLIWKGFPKGALSLLNGEPGLGATRLWLQAAARLTQDQKWVAWINGKDTQLNGGNLRHFNLRHLLCVSAPVDLAQKLWAIQELASLCLFELIACDLENEYLRDGQLLKLKKIAMRNQVGLVLLSRRQRCHPFFSLALDFDKTHITVARALHRPTPHLLERRDLYADTLPQLASGRTALRG